MSESKYADAGNFYQSNETIWLNNRPVAQFRKLDTSTPGGILGNVTFAFYYILTDHLNTPRKVTNSTGTVLWSWNSDAFGTTPANQDVDGNGTDFEFNLRFPGQYFDKESGQHYNYFRDYESGTGRYLESDPIGLDGGLNNYSYVLNNSLINFDQKGTDVWTEGGLHLRICVETPFESRNQYGGIGVDRFCISFAAVNVKNPFCGAMCPGSTYPDFDEPGVKRRYKKTNPYQDIFIAAILLDNTFNDAWYSLIGYNCRTFSNKMFDYIDENFE